MSIEQFVNGSSQTTLSASITSSATSLTVASASGFPTVPQFRIRIEDELLLVTAVSGTTWTVQRGVEGTAAVSHTSGLSVNWVFTAGALNQFRADNIQVGPIASLPNPSDTKEGMMYATSDSCYIYRHNGTSWDAFGPIWRWNPPNPANFTGANLSGCTIDTTKGVLRLSCPSSSTYQLRCHWMNIPNPSSDYFCEVVGAILEPSAAQAWGYGLALRESSSGKIVMYGPMYYNSGAQIKIDLQKWNTETSFNADYFSLLSQLANHSNFQMKRIWLSIFKDSTTRYFQFSHNGLARYTIYSNTNTDYITPDQYGFYVVQGSGTNAPECTFQHWGNY
jgi:hypothetical protein